MGEPSLLFVSFEGGEGAGKTTQASILIDRLEALEIPCVRVREPGSTALGTYLREWIKRPPANGQPMSRETELFLFAAARSELVTKVIEPQADDGGVVVVADRYADSTTAYQGYGRGIEVERVEVVNDLATHGRMPDLTFLLDCRPEVGISRVRGLQLQMQLDTMMSPPGIDRGAEGTRFEEEPIEFHERVRLGFLHLAEQDPDRWRVLNASRSIESISEEIWREVQSMLPVKQPAQHESKEKDDTTR